MKPALILSLLALGAAVGGGIWLARENSDLRERVASLEARTAAGGVDPVEAEGGGPSLLGSSARREMAELRGTSDALMARMEQLEARAKDAARPAAGAQPGAAAAGRPDFAEAVREVVLEMAAEDVDFRARIGTGERTKLKDAPFTKVADTLKLDASQEAAMSKDLQMIQQELFGVLAEERADGVVPMEMIAKAEGMKEGDPRRAQVFIKLFTMKIPGTDETYMQRAVKLTQGFRAKADKYLRAEQQEILDAVEIDWFSIKFD